MLVVPFVVVVVVASAAAAATATAVVVVAVVVEARRAIDHLSANKHPQRNISEFYHLTDFKMICTGEKEKIIRDFRCVDREKRNERTNSAIRVCRSLWEVSNRFFVHR